MKIRGTFKFIAFIAMMTSIMVLIVTTSTGVAQPKPTVKPIIIGMVVPLKFLYGEGAVRAATLAIEEINAAGGVNVAGVRYPFKLEAADGRENEPGTPVTETLIVVEKLILDKGAKFFVGGPFRSEAALAAMDLFSKHKAIAIFGGGTLTPELSKRIANNQDKYKYIFRQSGDVRWLVKEFTELFAGLETSYGFKKAYIAVQDVAHARAAGDVMESTLKGRGWAVLGKDKFPTGSSDFSPSLLKAKEGGAQVLFAWFDAMDVLVMVKQWYDLKIPVLPLGFPNYVEPFETWKQTDGKCEYWICTDVFAGVCYANFNPWVERWWNAYKKRWGREPEMMSTPVPYTIVYVLKDAIERAGSLETDKVVKALEETDLRGTPQGRIRFDRQDHQTINSFNPEEGAVGSIFQWQGGKRVLIFPPKIAVGKIQLPPWMKIK